MAKLISAKQARKLTKERVNLEVINSSVEWLNEVIQVAANNGESEVDLSIELWSDITNMNGILVKEVLSKAGYNFEDFYKEDSSVMNPRIKFQSKRVRISW
jgi:hypothetical protein